MGFFDNFCVILFKEELRKKLRNFLKIKIEVYMIIYALVLDSSSIPHSTNIRHYLYLLYLLNSVDILENSTDRNKISAAVLILKIMDFHRKLLQEREENQMSKIIKIGVKLPDF